MPYKIFTYANPYELDKTPFWNDIKALPHFCVARTLVNGLVDVMRDSIEGLICPLDYLVKHKNVYKAWEDNIPRRIEQYSYLTKLFDSMKGCSNYPKKEEFFSSLAKNQGQFLDAIRLFIELNISASSLHTELAQAEQKLFISVLSKIQIDNTELFRFPQTPNLLSIKKTIDDLANNEIEEYKKNMRKSGREPNSEHLAWLLHNKETTISSKLTGIVVHGVHQFTAAQIRLITELEKQGLTIIFLFNYQPKFSAIYDSWINIYSNFDVNVNKDGKDHAIIPPEFQTESYALATALGLLFEGKFSPANPDMRASYDKYKSCTYIKFANLTEYAHYVASCVDSAKRKQHIKQATSEHEIDSKINLGQLDEQVYTVNRDIHDILNVYFPEFSKNRHFLSYPIGQFFSVLYRLWNWESGEITFDLSAVRECISSGLLGPARAEVLLRVSYILEVVLSDVEKFSGDENSFLEMMAKYLELYDEVSRSVEGTNAAKAKDLSIYDPDTITREEILLFTEAIKKLNEYGIYLFGQSHKDYIEFGNHFSRLEKLIKQKRSDLTNEVEIVLVNDLLGRFDFITSVTKDASGTFNDLRQGLYFYLKQKQNDNRSEWIVKNFEQIDGDILQSRRQNFIHRNLISKGDRQHKLKTYHFATLSDRDMNVDIDDLLPWPLTDQFILKAYSPIDLQFQVYYSALTERSSFLRYALFYGLYFNQCDTCLSYVEQVHDEITDPYSPFTILGLKYYNYIDDIHSETDFNKMPEAPELNTTISVKPTSYNLMSMMLCPHRYLMEYVVDAKPIANSSFLYQKVFENSLIANTWQYCSNMPIELVANKFKRVIYNEAKKLKKYYFFWKEIQIIDICRRVANYFEHEILPKQVTRGFLNTFAGKERHTKIRKLYGQGSIFIDISEYEPQNPYPAFEAAAIKNGNQKIYRLHQFKDREPVDSKYLSDMRSYLSKKINEKETVVSDWCTYCSFKNICLDPFIRKEKE